MNTKEHMTIQHITLQQYQASVTHRGMLNITLAAMNHYIDLENQAAHKKATEDDAACRIKQYPLITILSEPYFSIPSFTPASVEPEPFKSGGGGDYAGGGALGSWSNDSSSSDSSSYSSDSSSSSSD